MGSRAVRMAMYASLVVVGAVGTWYFNLQFMQDNGATDIAAFGRAAFANPAAGSLSMDILISAPAGMILFLAEARRLGMRHVWVYFAVSCTVAFAAGFPLFLYMRERRLAELEAEGSSAQPAGAA